MKINLEKSVESEAKNNKDQISFTTIECGYKEMNTKGRWINRWETSKCVEFIENKVFYLVSILYFRNGFIW